MLRTQTELNGFLDLGFNDFVASRTLLLNDMLPQGAGLAATAIEKYLKAYALFQGHNLRGHISEQFVERLKNGPTLPPFISENFLTFLSRSYRLRYFDDIGAGYSLVIHRRQLLAELDQAIGNFEGAFKLEYEGGPHPTRGQRAVMSNDLRILHENHVLFQGDKTQYIEQEDLVYEIRFLGAMNIMEALYRTSAGKNDNNFLRVGLVQDGNAVEFAYRPIVEGSLTFSWAGIGPEIGSTRGLSSLL